MTDKPWPDELDRLERLVATYRVNDPRPDPGLNMSQVHREPRDTEVAAADRVYGKTGYRRLIILGKVIDAGARGYTSKEAAAFFGLPLHTVAPRFTELNYEKGLGWIVPSENRRGGAIAWVYLPTHEWEERRAHPRPPTPRAILGWIIRNLLTEEQLDVEIPGAGITVRHAAR